MRVNLHSCLLVVMGVLLAGCSSSDPPDQPSEDSSGLLTDLDVSDASEAQAEEISDGAVSEDEYRAAFQRYRQCLSSAGYELTNVKFTNNVYKFGVPDAAVQDGADNECYVLEYRYTDMLWQGTDAVQENSETAQFLRECLQEHGIEPEDTPMAMEEQLRDAGIEVPDCPA